MAGGQRIEYALGMTTSSGAQFEISIDGAPRTYRDCADFATEAAGNLKRTNPHSKVAVRDMRADEQTVVPSYRCRPLSLRRFRGGHVN
jgi:hypothetical protein